MIDLVRGPCPGLKEAFGVNQTQVEKAQYQFRVVSNGVELRKEDCPTFSDPDELWHEAAMSACEMVREMFGRIEPGLAWSLEVCDEADEVISRFSFNATRLK